MKPIHIDQAQNTAVTTVQKTQYMLARHAVNMVNNMSYSGDTLLTMKRACPHRPV